MRGRVSASTAVRVARVAAGAVLAAWGAAAAGPDAIAPELVRFVTDVEEAKGHLVASRELYAIDQRGRAALHGAHPVQEIGQRLIGPVSRADADLGARLRGLLRKPGRDLDARAPTARYAETVAQVFATLDEAVDRVVPEDVRRRPDFHTAVARALLATVLEEYEEAYRDGRIVQVIEYQDAWGFLGRARARYDAIRPAPGPETAAAIEREFQALAAILPDLTPPRSPATPRALRARVDALSAALDGVGRR
jgi:hypothetical protein